VLYQVLLLFIASNRERQSKIKVRGHPDRLDTFSDVPATSLRHII
jgi:hypothetical protein